MNILDRYLMKVTLQGCGVVLIVVAVLTLFVNFIGQSDDIGKGVYDVWDALFFAMLTLPSQLYQSMPIVTLLGALIGLGGLATNSELNVIRLSGASVWRIVFSLLITGGLIMVLTGAFGEFIAPPLDQAARQFRTLKQYQKMSIAGSNTSAWIKEGNDIISIEQMMSQGEVGGLYIYGFDDQRRLRSVIRADGARTDSQGNWYLENMRESHLSDYGVSASSAELTASPGLLKPELLELSAIDTDYLSARGLNEYYRYLRKNDLESSHYEQAFWSRIATTASVPLMLLLALPFVLGPMRSSGIGARLIAGIVIGMSFRLASRSLYYSGDVFNLDPLLVGWGPVALLILIVAVGLNRVH